MECIWVSSNEVDEPRAYSTEWSQKEEDKYHILTYVYMGSINGTDEPICRAAVEMPT